jgi:epoxyqueuosine reductase QueG
VGGRPDRPEEINEILRRIHDEQEPRFTGDVAAEQRKFISPADAAQHLKDKSREFGADIVGICAIEPSDVYRGRTCEHTFAIAVGQRMRWREFQVVPSRESAIECLRVYYTLGETVIQLAAHIRSLGYACTVEHPIGDSDLLHIPIGLKAGFGELGRHGSIIHPQLGPLFRMGSVATSLPLAIDRPIDAGIARFCDTCRACRKYCPPHAIPDERSPEAGADHLGYDRYVVDTGRCFPYFSKHHYCSICLPVCVYNHKEWARDFEGFATRLFPTVLMPEPPVPVDPVPAQPVHWYPRLGR